MQSETQRKYDTSRRRHFRSAFFYYLALFIILAYSLLSFNVLSIKRPFLPKPTTCILLLQSRSLFTIPSDSMQMKRILQSKRSSPRSHHQHALFAMRIMQALHVQRTQRILAFVFCFLVLFHALFQLQPEPVPSTASSYSPLIAAATTTTPQSVYLWPPYFDDTTKPHNTEIVQLAYNGIVESPYLQLTNDSIGENVVWVGDAGNGYWYGYYPWARAQVLQFLLRIGVLGRRNWGYDRSPWCAVFLQEIRTAQRERKRRGLPLQWPIYILDLTDFSHLLRCPTIEQAMGSERVFYGKRSIVQGRFFSKDQQWTQLGQTVHLASSYLHTPLIVRTDTVQAVQDLLVHKYNQTLASPIETLPRNVDVAHFWAVSSRQSFKIIKGSRSNLRNLVSNVITELGNEHPEVNAFVGFAGTHGTKGRYDVASAYIDALLNTKIAVGTF